MRIVHFVLGLGKGGAETMLFNSLRYRSDGAVGSRVEVVTLGLSEYYDAKIEALGVPVYNVSYRSGRLRALLRARHYFRTADVVCCWLYGANVLGWVSTLGLKARLVWNIRHADLSRENNSRSTRLAACLSVLLSKRVAAIAYNGAKSQKVHEKIGYPRSKGVVLANGTDVGIYDVRDSRSLRSNLGLRADVRVVLSVARWHPIKDQENFLRAFALVRESNRSSVAVMCGRFVNAGNTALMTLIADLGLSDSVLLLGERLDLPELYSMADVYVLHSRGEAFPNTLIEAMACGCLVVATDVGEVRDVLAPGQVPVPAGDRQSLAEAILLELSRSEKTAMRQKILNRDHVVANYNIETVAKDYEAVCVFPEHSSSR